MIPKKIHPFVKHTLAIITLSSILLFYFFTIMKFDQYPWWHYFGNDIDGAYTGQTLAVVNGGELEFLHHPGATVYAVHGAIYKMLSVVKPEYKSLVALNAIVSAQDANDILDKATRLSRVITGYVSVLFIIVMYFLMYLFSASSALSFLGALFVATSIAFLRHTFWIRPELFNLLFFLLALYCGYAYLPRAQRTRTFALCLIGCGILIGFSIFSKIQIGPLVVLFFAVLLAYFIMRPRASDCGCVGKKGLWLLLLPAANILIIPWWALRRPAFIDHEFILSLQVRGDFRKLYGATPENFYGIVIVLFGILSGISLATYFLNKRNQSNRGLCIASVSIQAVWWVLMGMLLSIYMILLPITTSFKQYIEHTRHLVYATCTNLVYGGYLTHRAFNLDTFNRIFQLHQKYSTVAGINILYLAAFIAIVSAQRVFSKRGTARDAYLWIFVFFLGAMGMDLFATLRSARLYPHYSFYSLSIYSLGIIRWLSLETRLCLSSVKDIRKDILGTIAPVLVVGLLTVQCAMRLLIIGTMPPADGISRQGPMPEYINSRTHATSFWHIVDSKLKDEANISEKKIDFRYGSQEKMLIQRMTNE